jgi:hypothetical protein
MTTTLLDLQTAVRNVNVANGWHDDERTHGEDRTLIHSEISEALEAYRDHGYDDVTIHPGLCRGCGLDEANPGHQGDHDYRPPKPEGVASELADVLIRLLDTVDRWQVTPYWLLDGYALDDVLPYRVPSARFGDWLDVMHTATAKDDHQLLLRTVAGAALLLVDVDLEQEVVRKVAYNATRGHKHGGKRL